MNNEPVAWIPKGMTLAKPKDLTDCIPLYTHPANIIAEILEKNKPEIEKANAYIKSLEDEIKALKAKTLTDAEIKEVYGEYFDIENCDWIHLQCIQAILKKASEK